MNLHDAARVRLRAEKNAEATAKPKSAAAKPLTAKPAAERPTLKAKKVKEKAAAKPRRKRRYRAMNAVLDTAGVLGAVAFAFVFNLAVNHDAIAQEPRAIALLAAITATPLDPVEQVELAEAPVITPAVEPDPAEVRLLAATAWAEARSEGEPGMRAVAHVIVNRVGARFGDDLEDVIRSPKQFSAWNLGDPNRPLAQNPERYARGGINRETWQEAQKVAREVLSGQSVDPTEGALFYHTAAIRPWWSRYGQGRQRIGAHVFYSDVPDRRG